MAGQINASSHANIFHKLPPSWGIQPQAHTVSSRYSWLEVHMAMPCATATGMKWYRWNRRSTPARINHSGSLHHNKSGMAQSHQFSFSIREPLSRTQTHALLFVMHRRHSLPHRAHTLVA